MYCIFLAREKLLYYIRKSEYSWMINTIQSTIQSTLLQFYISLFILSCITPIILFFSVQRIFPFSCSLITRTTGINLSWNRGDGCGCIRTRCIIAENHAADIPGSYANNRRAFEIASPLALARKANRRRSGRRYPQDSPGWVHTRRKRIPSCTML